jgi:hypothetical protein
LFIRFYPSVRGRLMTVAGTFSAPAAREEEGDGRSYDQQDGGGTGTDTRTPSLAAAGDSGGGGGEGREGERERERAGMAAVSKENHTQCQRIEEEELVCSPIIFINAHPSFNLLLGIREKTR